MNIVIVVLKIFTIYNKIDNRWKYFMYVGAVLKNVRESKGFSLVEIQNRTGIKESQLCRIESGTRFPTDDQIIILAKLYSLNKVDLIIQRDSDKLLGTVKDL